MIPHGGKQTRRAANVFPTTTTKTKNKPMPSPFHFRPLLFAAMFALLPPAQIAAAHGAPIPEYNQASSLPAAAAQAFLDSLSPAEKAAAMLDLKDPARANGWSNLPASSVRRPGIRAGDLSDPQWDLMFKFLSAALSPRGYQAAADAIAAEAILESNPRAARLQWSPDNYWLAFFGEPSESGKWGWQFGGHHLAFNMALEGNKNLGISPTFVGAEPANFTLQGKQYQPVARMHQAGTAVYEALDENQQSDARLFFGVRDLETGPGEDGNIPDTKGSPVKEWSDAQRELLTKAIGEWVRMQPDENAEKRMKVLTEQLDETYFAWNGPVDASDDNYFRIQGPSVIIELLWQGAVGVDSEGHYHTIYRDPTNEYGTQLQ